MELDPQHVINLLFTAVGALGGWVLNNLRQSINNLLAQDAALTEKVQKIEVLVVGDYVKRTEMDSLGAAIFAKLDRIENKLDKKADK
ncbi:MAG: hypothetical protein CMQ46_05680 [Gammaproteobacteria bacterium]|nr:hypothetical protein [Gammaproteobacteria bacterium]MBJ54735.1 hypothetical protein [Gammaproteobacteria bacterium]|tara:strand:- start:957 stop:1217 length:261 start_codon:yes stop_codon:yes gene_type:complete